ncbi:single-stranded DNA-binding protein [Bacteroidetes/Chlorobi group bacterium ChocPot_Mid]|nr:MAG: single-stranded DNA-binding protein [Bacteroidetes/Chlorobi group bacterium ChocPot_Mid]
MAKSLNRVTLLGNLGADPEFRTTPNGTPVASFRMATTETFKDKNGEWQDLTEWHNVSLWNRLAEIARDYLRKGSKVYIEGRLRTRSYEDKDKTTKYFTEVVANNLILLTPKDGHSETDSDKSYIDENVVASVNEPMEDDVPF